jgi:hypothetical protein
MLIKKNSSTTIGKTFHWGGWQFSTVTFIPRSDFVKRISLFFPIAKHHPTPPATVQTSDRSVSDRYISFDIIPFV